MLALAEVAPITNEKLVTYLRYSCRFSELLTLAERDVIVLDLCKQLDITVSDEELQAAGDVFRQENRLLSALETHAWLERQRVTVEEWTYGIRVALLEKKLKENLFSSVVDSLYLTNRDNFKRVALSQILVYELTDALKIIQALKDRQTSFCSLALEHSQGKQTRENGGFAGIRLIAELMPELAQAIEGVKAGNIVDSPVKTNLGYHILRVEKWFPIDLREVRDWMLDSLFLKWLKHKDLSFFHSSMVAEQLGTEGYTSPR